MTENTYASLDAGPGLWLTDTEPASVDTRRLRADRLERVRAMMREKDYAAVLLFDPFNQRYATGSRNMFGYFLRNSTRYFFVPTEGPVLLFEYPQSAHVSTGLEPLTTRYVGGIATAIQNPYGPEGQDTALSPPLKWNLRGRYDWPMGSYIWFVQGGLQHQAQSISSTTYFTQFRMPSWTTLDASAGVSEGNWTVSLNGSNLTNVDKSLFTTDTEIILTETPMRPRVISLNFGYSWTQHD